MMRRPTGIGDTRSMTPSVSVNSSSAVAPCRPNVIARNQQRGSAPSLPRIPLHGRVVWVDALVMPPAR